MALVLAPASKSAAMPVMNTETAIITTRTFLEPAFGSRFSASAASKLAAMPIGTASRKNSVFPK